MVEHLEEADSVEFSVGEEPGSHDVTHDLTPHRGRRVADRSFAGLDAADLGVSLRQRLLQKETIPTSDLEE